ncbi:MAG: hypothetical protein K1060chlam1_00229 [Candidatus Anoxychlamydiales bacterium]|nr:hypothetical protein [Candidatus Anoxychlamydiales bacterium]
MSSCNLMIPREIPKYLATAYGLKYNEIEKNENFLKRSILKIYRLFLVTKEILNSIVFPTSKATIDNNINKLQLDFQKKNRNLSDISNKDICVYIVGSYDNAGGAILGNHLYYYHHYKIENFEKYFDVVAKVVSNNKDIAEFLNEIKNKYPSRNIKVMDIVCHGNGQTMHLGETQDYMVSSVKEAEYKGISKDGTIIIDACSTASLGSKSIASEIAKKNPSITVFAPATSLFFSKPLINPTTKKVENVFHGPGILRAQVCKKFKYEALAMRDYLGGADYRGFPTGFK